MIRRFKPWRCFSFVILITKVSTTCTEIFFKGLIVILCLIFMYIYQWHHNDAWITSTGPNINLFLWSGGSSTPLLALFGPEQACGVQQLVLGHEPLLPGKNSFFIAPRSWYRWWFFFLFLGKTLPIPRSQPCSSQHEICHLQQPHEQPPPHHSWGRLVLHQGYS